MMSGTLGRWLKHCSNCTKYKPWSCQGVDWLWRRHSLLSSGHRKIYPTREADKLHLGWTFRMSGAPLYPFMHWPSIS